MASEFGLIPEVVAHLVRVRGDVLAVGGLSPVVHQVSSPFALPGVSCQDLTVALVPRTLACVHLASVEVILLVDPQRRTTLE